MNHSKPGITLTELLVFLWIFSLFATVVIMFLARSSVVCSRFNKKGDAVASITSAGDWLARDVHNADTERDTITVQDTTLVLANPQEKIAWKLMDTTLVRTIQRFDNQFKIWKKPHTAHVAQNVKKVLFKLLTTLRGERTLVKGIQCDMSYALGEHVQSVSYKIAFRNGVV